MWYMEITEYWTGKRHYRKIKSGDTRSINYKVEGKYLVVRDYWTGEKLQRFDVSKFGSIQYRVIDKRRGWQLCQIFTTYYNTPIQIA